jgi:cell division transport system ATP-binding protein
MLFVTGHSGAGKSTLLKLIQLAERPSRGAVLFGEKNLAKVRGGKVALHRRSVGVVYQNHQLLMDRTVGENVSLPLILRGMKRGEIGKRVRSMLERLGLGPREKRPALATVGRRAATRRHRARARSPNRCCWSPTNPPATSIPRLSAEIMALFAALPERGTSVLVSPATTSPDQGMRKRVLRLD